MKTVNCIGSCLVDILLVSATPPTLLLQDNNIISVISIVIVINISLVEFFIVILHVKKLQNLVNLIYREDKKVIKIPLRECFLIIKYY